MPVRIVIQSRLTSKRLFAKALLPIEGIPSVLLCVRRAANSGLSVVVATSTDPTDNTLANFLCFNSIPVVRGSLDDVLLRFVDATSDMAPDDIVVRLTADNVFPDGNFIESLLTEMRKNHSEFVTTTYKDSLAPYGLSAEVLTVGLLRQANKAAKILSDREHVTPWIIRNLKGPHYLSRFFIRELPDKSMGSLRCTMDTFDDYRRLVKVFDGTDPIRISWQQLCDKLALQEMPHTVNKGK